MGDEFLLPYIFSNIIAFVLILICWKRPTLGRIAFGIIFIAASIANGTIVLQNPDSYQDYAKFAYLEVYRSFITGFFAAYTQPIVLFIAACQFLIGLSLLTLKPLRKLALIGAILFFLAITPLGTGSAFPATLLMGIAVLLLTRQEFASPAPNRN